MTGWGWLLVVLLTAEGVFFAVKAGVAENARDRERRRADAAEQRAAVHEDAYDRLTRIEARARVAQKLGPNREQRRRRS